MPLMDRYTEIIVEEDLLPQVVRELVDMAMDQNHVEVVHGVVGRVILAQTDLAEAWYQKAIAKEQGEKVPESDVAQSNTPESETSDAANVAASELSITVPVKRGPGRPRTIQPAPSVSNGEES